MPGLDARRVAALWEGTVSLYDREKAQFREDARLVPNVRDFLRDQFRPEFRVLDIGCGRGETLLANADRFAEGIGIDNDRSVLNEAEVEAARLGIRNVSFHASHSSDLPFGRAEFDLIFSERGPLSGASINIQAALRVLKTGGLLFAETIGEMDNFELAWLMPRDVRPPDPMTVLEQVKVLFARNGVDVRVMASLVTKRWYPDIYEFLRVAFAVMRYQDMNLNVTDAFLRRLEDFVDAVETSSGEIPQTLHRVWIGGVKSANPREYWEWKFFPDEN